MFGISSDLPAHCEPTNDFLRSISLTFDSCVPTPLALLSSVLGVLSILSWLFAQVPQILKNFDLRSTSGLSVLFLGEWLLGDVSNLLGSIFTGQATWQVVLATYYTCVDCVLCGQWVWYEHLHHGRTVRRVRWWRKSRAVKDGETDHGSNSNNTPTVLIEGVPTQHQQHKNVKTVKSKPIAARGGIPGDGMSPDVTGSEGSSWRPSSIFTRPQFASYSSIGSTLTDSPPSTENRPQHSETRPRPILRVPRAESPTPSPRTVLYITLLICLAARGNPISSTLLLLSSPPNVHHTETSTTEWIGGLFSWLSTILYLASRLPQLLHNASRRSTEGLSPTLFLAAFFGNLFYSSSLLTNPSLWHSFGPYGGGGWASPHGSSRHEWAARAAPFFLGAAGVLLMDAAVGVQFLMYAQAHASDTDGGSGAAVLVVEAEGVRGAGRWRRVSGWMRGWVPEAAARAGRRTSRKSGAGGGGGRSRGWSRAATDGYDSAETESLLSNGTATPTPTGAGRSMPRGGYGGTAASVRRYE